MSTNWIDKLSESDAGRTHLDRERVKLEAAESICRLMEIQGVGKSELAKRLGRSPAFVTKILRGTNNFTLITLADVFRALDRSLHLAIGPAGDGVQIPHDCGDQNSYRFDEWKTPRATPRWQAPCAPCFKDEEPEFPHKNIAA
ncbi:MAG: hypothetical protein JSR77_18620 [Planctomycetes bacterium]|nr:hypothetical protein [Planctomycetota bacterium]